MANAIRVVPVADRINRIAQAAVLRQHFMPFKGQNTHNVIELPVDLPVYRMTNMRTDVMQLEFILETGKDERFFVNGQEDPEAQAAQHDFLLALAKNKLKNIYERLTTIAEQVEPLAVTKAGVVLNGNRRLAAMRALFASDPATFARFQNIQVAILPDADESELTALETDLQIAEDLRLPYGWVEEARGLRRQIDLLGWDFSRAQSHWGKKESELKGLLSRLALAEEYLVYRGQPRHYALVAADDQAFQTLQKELASQAASGADASALEARKYVEFAVLAQPAGTITGSTHSYAAKIDEITARVLKTPTVTAVTGWTPSKPAPAPGTGTPPEPASATDTATPTAGTVASNGAPGGAVATSATSGTAAPVDIADPLAALPVAPTASQVPASVLSILKDPTKGTVIAAAADQARDDIADEAKQAKRGTALAKSAQTINSTAAGLSLTNASDGVLEEAAVQLSAALLSITECLRQIVAERPEIGQRLDRQPLVATASKLAELAPTGES